MPELSVTAQVVTADPPARAFERLSAGELLEFDCDRLTPGRAVSVRLPISSVANDGRGDASITLLGHIVSVRPGRMVVVTHHQPWKGRLVVRFLADGDGTRIVLEDRLDDEGVAWLANTRGFERPDPPRLDRHRIGLLVSKSGSAAVFAQAAESLALLAVDEINADGGIHGTTVELLVGDDASDAATGVAAADRLVRSGCRAIFACVTSATFSAASAAHRDAGVLMIHSVLNEGGPPSRHTVRLGERPLEQLRVGVPALMQHSGGRRWFFVGHRYSWSFGAHWAARRVVAENGGQVAGEAFQPLGTADFGHVITRIEQSGADLILSTLVGNDEVVFERQCAASGIRTRARTLALVLDEATMELIGNAAAEGVWAAFAYFEGFGDRDAAIEARYAARATGPLPPMSSLSETTYEAIIAYARAAQVAADSTMPAIRERLVTAQHSGSPDAAPVRRAILLAESHNGRFSPR